MSPAADSAHTPLSIAFVAAEVAPFAKTGGLGEVMGSLPQALARRGHRVCVFVPLYGSARRCRQPIHPTDVTFTVPVGTGQVGGRICHSTLPGSDVPVFLVEHWDYFERDEPLFGHTIYQFKSTYGDLRDYPDNDSRYVFFSRAVLAALPQLGWQLDVLHCNDWQTGLLPVYVRTTLGHDPYYQRIRNVFTIHNQAYQGRFGKGTLAVANLGWELFKFDLLEFHDGLNFLKAGIVFSDAVTTVSRRYAQEIQGYEEGYGLDSVLRAHSAKLLGISNGVDYAVWNPATDRHIAANYTSETLEIGKLICKADLQRRAGLPVRSDVPVVGMVTRLAEQKGIDILMDAAPGLLALGIQFVLLGNGEPRYEHFFRHLATQHPHQVAAAIQFNESLAHAIVAGSDITLMPSRFEPSGLNQLYALKYGSVPVVRETGGLADTVLDCNDWTWHHAAPTGFLFSGYDATGLLWGLRRAVDCWRQAPHVWRQLQRNGMAQDWSWDRGAAEYEHLYRRLVVPRS